MIELLMLLIAPTEINPQKIGIKYLLKEKFVDYQTCEEYVVKNTYTKPGEQEFEGVFYKIDTKEYKVFLTYCKKIDDN
jgi:hypothetical protein|tara:strand:- start:250 stop:483 length:234 start_codon:yes stop_codon:yes gene_type:complete